MRIAWPGPGRITVALLTIVPAALVNPWVAGVLAVLLFGWWNGLHFDTIVGRWLSMLIGRSRRPTHEAVSRSGADARTTAVLRVLPDAADGALPLDVIGSYLTRYGLSFESVRVTSRDAKSGRSTWIGLTMSAAANLDALQARSESIPLRETAEVALRRLADHLRELGWAVSTTDVDIPDLLGAGAKEHWRYVADGKRGYLAAYAVPVNDALPNTLAELMRIGAAEVWTAIEFLADSKVAVAAAIRTQDAPGRGGPVPGLVSIGGHQLSALDRIAPDSTRSLEAEVGSSAAAAGLDWTAHRAHRAPAKT